MHRFATSFNYFWRFNPWFLVREIDGWLVIPVSIGQLPLKCEMWKKKKIQKGKDVMWSECKTVTKPNDQWEPSFRFSPTFSTNVLRLLEPQATTVHSQTHLKSGPSLNILFLITNLFSKLFFSTKKYILISLWLLLFPI